MGEGIRRSLVLLPVAKKCPTENRTRVGCELRMRLPWEAELCGRKYTCLEMYGNVQPGKCFGCAETQGQPFWGVARDSRSAEGK